MALCSQEVASCHFLHVPLVSGYTTQSPLPPCFKSGASKRVMTDPGYIPIETTPVEDLLAQWQWRQDELSQVLKTEVVFTTSIVLWLWLLRSSYTVVSNIIQCIFRLPLEVDGPGGSLSKLLLLRHTGETPVGECPGRQKWRLWHTVATWWWWRSSFGCGDCWQWRMLSFRGAGFLKCCDFLYFFLVLFSLFSHN